MDQNGSHQSELVQFGGAGIIGNKSINYDVPLKRSRFFLEKILFHPETVIEKIMNSSLSGFILIIRMPTKITEKYNLVTIDEANMKKNRRVTRLLVKLVLVGSKSEYYYINGRKKRVDTEMGFMKEVDIQRYLFKRSLQNGVPICPSIMYSSVMDDYALIFDRFSNIPVAKDIIRQYQRIIFTELEREIKKMKSKPKLGIIAMELAEDYEPVAKMKKLTKSVLDEIIKKFYILYLYGFMHRDEHKNNIMYNPETNYALIIDFGRTVQFSKKRYDTFKYYIYSTRLGDWQHIAKMIPKIDESKIDFDINNVKTIPEIFRDAGLDPDKYILLDNNLIKFSYKQYHEHILKKKTKKAEKKKTKKAEKKKQNKTRKSPAKAASQSPAKSTAKLPTQSPKNNPVAKPSNKPAVGKAKAVVNGCKGLSPSACEAKTGCKVARGAKRTFCRSQGIRKKHKTRSRSITQKTPKKPAQAPTPPKTPKKPAQAQVKGCKGLSPSACQAKSNCKVARGAKRTFCRNATNKKK
jgi:hypothetical protein